MIRGFFRVEPRYPALRGWVCNLAQPHQAESIEILVNDQLVATCRADLQRGDLAYLGTGRQNYGFQYPLCDLPLEPGVECGVAVRVKSCGTLLRGDTTRYVHRAVTRTTVQAAPVEDFRGSILRQEVQTVSIDCGNWQGAKKYAPEMIGLVRNGARQQRYFRQQSPAVWSYDKQVVEARFRDALVIMPFGVVIVGGKVVAESLYLANIASMFPLLCPSTRRGLQGAVERMTATVLSRSPLDRYTLRLLQGNVERVEGSAFLLSRGPHLSYYHWHVDSLSNAARMAGPDSSVPDWLLCPAPVTEWHRSSLDILQAHYPGCPSPRFTEGLHVLQVSDLRYVSGLGGRQSFLSPEICTFYDALTASLWQLPAPTGIGPRLYLSRKSEGRRRLDNEDEIERMLESRGFSIINPAEFDYRTQIAIFQQADIVVAPHGAALTNILFSRQGISVLELLPDCYINVAVQRLANLKQARYGYLVGESNPEPGKAGEHAFIFRIDERELARMVDGWLLA